MMQKIREKEETVKRIKNLQHLQSEIRSKQSEERKIKQQEEMKQVRDLKEQERIVKLKQQEQEEMKYNMKREEDK